MINCQIVGKLKICMQNDYHQRSHMIILQLKLVMIITIQHEKVTEQCLALLSKKFLKV